MTKPAAPDVAIVGMGCVFPGAPDLDAFLRNLTAGVDATADVPPGRWDPVFYDPSGGADGSRFYCRRGGFIDGYATFDPVRHGVMPKAVQGAEPDQLLTLEVASRALADAGYGARPLPRATTGVILGRGGYAGAGRTRLEQHVRTAQQLVSCLADLLPGVPEAELARVKREFQAQLGAAGPDAAIGLVPNLAASRLAHRLDVKGPAFTVDAACASALVAVDQACRELASGRCDVVLAGGVHVSQDEAFWSVFCQLGALSRSGRSRPFHQDADGLLIGEGVGVVVLKRLADAVADRDRIYAVIKGAGVASDGREASLMSPGVEGQTLALERAWRESGLSPDAVGLLEAHGTGTPAGDATELTTLARFFGPPEGDAAPVLGSVKSMIGHTMPAAGAAGLIKAALAVHHGLLFPTLHCEAPRAELHTTRFRVTGTCEPWPGEERVAAVNAFGFGGINAHVVLASPPPSPQAPGRRERATGPALRKASVRPAAEADDTLAVFAAASPSQLLQAVADGREGGDGPARLVVFDPTPERLARARALVEKGRPYRGREGLWFSPRGLLAEGGTVAFLFPGVDAAFEPRVDDVARHFGVPVPPFTTATNLEEVGLGIVGVNRLLDGVLRRLGLRPAAVAGHSIGEWSAMVSVGMIPEPALDAFLTEVRPGTLEVPGVVFAAAGCGVEQAEEAMLGLEGIALSHDNCPHQVLLCGREEPIAVALDRLRRGGILCQKLPFQSGFHSPLFEGYLGPHQANFARLPLAPPREPLWSATTAAPFPDDLGEVRALALRHLVEPVRFRALVEALYASGVRAFVQVGTGSLVQFVEDTLRGRPHVALSANTKDRSGLGQLRRLVAALYVEGASLDPAAGLGAVRRRTAVPLALGVPLVRLRGPLRGVTPEATEEPLPAHPLAAEFAASLGELARAQRDVMRKLTEPSRPRPGPREATVTRELSVATLPEVMGHTFYRQAPGWPTLSDLHPVVPMTASLQMMMEHAAALVPGRVVVAMEDVRAYRWLAVATPVHVPVRAAYDGKDRVKVRLGDYAEGTAVLADAYPPAPPADEAPLAASVAPGITARELYDERWMFHGPAYQGIVHLDALGDDGIRGDIETGAARGALLDNAGQLFGYWVMARYTSHRLAMPIGLRRVELFGPHPQPGERLTCTVRIRHVDDGQVGADLCLARGGRSWARIQGWEDRRFDTEGRLWPVLLWPEKNTLAEPLAPGMAVFVDRHGSAPTREQLARRFLTEAERAAYERVPPRSQRAWLSTRIAAKDAVRSLLLPGGDVFPAEVTLHDGEGGALVAQGPRGFRCAVATAARGDLYAAAAGRAPVLVAEDAARAPADLDDGEARLGAGEDAVAFARRVATARATVAAAFGSGAGALPPRARDRGDARLLLGDSWAHVTRYRDTLFGWMGTGT